tara:strand:+ start:285 stop:443 length:159 start_codon:yes stop_codon:yes gene_type:complete
MKWIIDLLIDEWNKSEKDKEFEPIPLHIEQELPPIEEEEKENDEKRVIIIDL